ncbi:hypothetical protein BM526_12875 [Alteromonas mediterranea]|uniref:O-antigen ligase family protein n=1 Tax=Alteromonas mediterranea TaxID=314275 RepID=UPI0009031CC3|nr:O-antigen ligase family protein [Alteromonas mediterranea]APE02664.1 hypothetical protein BM526_12875 [Alteromonas mediterranea]
MKVIQAPESKFFFNLYLLFIVSYLLRFTARVSVLGAIRFDLLIAGVLFIGLLKEAQKAKDNFDHPITKSLYAILIYVALTLPFVEWPGSVLKGNLILFIKALMFFFFTIAFVNSPAKLRKILVVYVLCQTFRVLEPLYMNITQGYWGSATHVAGGEFASRLSGSPYDVVNPNGLAFVICIAWAYWHYFVGNSEKFRNKLLYWGIASAFAYAMILTMSRSGLIALAVLGAFIFLASNRKFLIIIILVSGSIFAFSQMTDIQKERVLSITGSQESSQSSSAQGRINFMFRMADVWLNRPIVGHGLGTSKEAGANYGEDAKIAHSIYFEVLIELGIIGFYFFMRFVLHVKNAIISVKSQVMEKGEFDHLLAQVLHSLLWVYSIFSIGYFGFSRSWWYFLAGIVVVQAGMMKKAEEGKEK